MKSLFRIVSNWFGQTDQDTHSVPRIIIDLPAPPPPPEPSCFVKGLIRSMEIEADLWVRFETRSCHGRLKIFWQHAKEGIGVSQDGRRVADAMGFGTIHRANSTEEAALEAAIFKYLANPLAKRQEERKLAELAAKRAPFEKLGCPEKIS